MTRYLCDTHVILWAATNPLRLTAEVRGVLSDASQWVGVSSVSIAEMAIKMGLGKLSMSTTPNAMAEAMGFSELPLTWSHANRVSELPLIHRDPFDRLLIAQAIDEDLMLITADPLIAKYPDVQMLLT
jgi:PIN domain nuclease of toxin-antitoxin system